MHSQLNATGGAVASRADLPVGPRRGGRHRWWRTRGLWTLTALVAAAAMAASSIVVAPSASANDTTSVSVDEASLRRALFTMHMRARINGADGFKDMMLSAEMIAYRQLHPQATRQQIIEHSVIRRNFYNSRLTADDLERPAYQFVLKLLELSAMAPGGTVAAPIMRELMESTVGTQLRNYGAMVDQITAAQFQHSWFQQAYEVQNWIWHGVANLSLADSTFREAWNATFGVQYNVDGAATIDSLAADPYLATWLNVNAILDNQQNNQQWLADTMAQLEDLLGAIGGRVDGYNEALRELLERFPLANDAAQPTAQDRRAAVQQANAAQQWINGAAGAVEVLALLAGFVDPRAGQTVAAVGRAASQIATAINQYLPTVAGLGLGAALTSMSTLALTGNVLGAISALLPIFAGGLSPEEQILDQLRALRQDVADLRTNMNDRFDRIERGLGTIYADMLEQFGVVIELQNATNAQLIQINERLAKLTEQVDMWGSAIFANQKTAAVSDIKRRINRGVGYEARTGRPLPYSDTSVNYSDLAEDLVFDATEVARDSRFIAPFTATDSNQALNMYGTYGSIGYLHHYGKGNGLGSGSNEVHNPVDAEAWLLAATGYQMLLAQNPEHGARTDSEQSDRLLAAGNQIQEAARDLSRAKKDPVAPYGHLNDLMRNAIMQYRVTAWEMSKRAAVIRDEIRGAGQHNPFAGPKQDVPAGQKPTADPATVPSCTAGGVALSRPSQVSYIDLPQALWVAQYGRADSPVQLCHESGWINVDTRTSGRWEITTADLQFSMRVRQKWDGTWRVVREWTKVFPLGEVCRVHVDGTPGACRQASQDIARWDSTYKAQFQQSASDVDNIEEARVRSTNWLHQQAADYYTRVSRELSNPNPTKPEETLYHLNQQLTKQARLMTSYIKLGFGTALQQDERISSNLVGRYRTPSDMDGTNMVTGPYEHARSNYCADNAFPCTLKPEAAIETSPLTGESRLGCNLQTTLDPVAYCLEYLTYQRTDVMRDQLVLWSKKLADKEYVEGLPAVELALQSIRTAQAVAAATPIQ
ncbi:hypothetical protein JMF97_10800 [Micromonospora fiedleri]|uniref:Uncharacterized protein n=1 Tax=Micromonospora fiedleri TaxID=1157498 RepID=A0ABS1UJY6_9ACTN|nr:hypothetical protein [Micromonospora fiedleri]MBL6276650.1 hypothetical protein [Micromonospora fiedleri]